MAAVPLPAVASSVAVQVVAKVVATAFSGSGGASVSSSHWQLQKK